VGAFNGLAVVDSHYRVDVGLDAGAGHPNPGPHSHCSVGPPPGDRQTVFSAAGRRPLRQKVLQTNKKGDAGRRGRRQIGLTESSTAIDPERAGYLASVPATSATIEQLARDTVQIADPETALRALGALRQELEQVEPELVRRALRTGASWSQIARALGVSKQAAHRKHRHLTDRDFDAVSDKHRILVTSDARRTIQFAREEARRLGQPALGTEHILLGILRSRGSPAATALNGLGVTHAVAGDVLSTTLPGVPAPSGEGAMAAPDVSPHARRILEGSLREALKRGDGYIGVEHLLLALLTDSRNGAVQTLEALNVTPRQIRQRLDQDWAEIATADLPPAG
jgi:transposase-like protein